MTVVCASDNAWHSLGLSGQCLMSKNMKYTSFCSWLLGIIQPKALINIIFFFLPFVPFIIKIFLSDFPIMHQASFYPVILVQLFDLLAPICTVISISALLRKLIVPPCECYSDTEEWELPSFYHAAYGSTSSCLIDPALLTILCILTPLTLRLAPIVVPLMLTALMISISAGFSNIILFIAAAFLSIGVTFYIKFTPRIVRVVEMVILAIACFCIYPIDANASSELIQFCLQSEFIIMIIMMIMVPRSRKIWIDVCIKREKAGVIMPYFSYEEKGFASDSPSKVAKIPINQIHAYLPKGSQIIAICLIIIHFGLLARYDDI